jgi:hypothetical protein
MEKNSLVIFLLLLLPLLADSQSRRKSFVKKDLFVVSGGLSTGVMVAHPIQDVFIVSGAEYFMESRVSIKSDIYWFLPDYNFEGQLQKNSSIFMGAAFHFPLDRWDTFFSFQPGLAFPALASGTNTTAKPGVEPLLASSLGVTYFILQNMHVFVSAGYVHGKYFPESETAFPLDELRLTAGLGFNVFFNRYAPYERRRVKF